MKKLVKRASIEFIETKKPILDPVTKFGGQPIWLSDPQWPISATTGNLMRFICQIRLSEDLFGSIEPQMAYIFMTDEEDYVDGTWEPDGGENAVILQSGDRVDLNEPLPKGPTLYRMVKKVFKKYLVPESCEFRIKSIVSNDPPYTPASERTDWSDVQWEEYANTLDGNKIGGTPIFVQDDEYPASGSWKLLLTLDSTRVPFSINFGDAGIAYAFISEDGTTGKFLWQCA